jgi:polar amino acid transport system substrate-binding protein
MNKKHFLGYLAIILLMMVYCVPAVGQKALATIVKNGELRVGTSGNQPPYSMKSKTGELMGFEIDLAKALATNMGVKLKWVEMPFPELMDALKSNKIDAIMSGMTITPERNLIALFAGPYTVSGKAILTKSNKVAALNADTSTMVNKYKIVCLKGSTSEEFVKTVMSKQQLIAVNNYDEAVNMVINDQADALVADKPICVLSILKYPGKDLVTTEQPLTVEPIGMALPSGDPQFLNLVSNYISTLQISGTLTALEQKWFKDGSWMLSVK